MSNVIRPDRNVDGSNHVFLIPSNIETWAPGGTVYDSAISL